jgi:hypothetical protein
MQHLDQKALADRWLVSPRTLEQWRWQGRGPRYLKIGGRVVYRQQDIEAFEAVNTELDRLHWPAAAIIAIPHDGKAGLAWFLNGEHVVALGPERAFFQDGRIFDRRLMALVEPETDGLPMTRERLPN